MKLRRLRPAAVSLSVFVFFVLVAIPAFAQVTPPPVLSVLSVPLAAIALLGLISAYVAQGATTGSVLGLFKISPKAIPYLSTVGTFLATLVAQLSIAAQANALTGTAVFNAIVIAFYMLVAPATGAAIRMHHDTPKTREILNAASIRPPPPSKAPPPIVGAMLVIFFVLGVGSISTATIGCGAATLTSIEQGLQTIAKADAEIVKDVNLGMTDDQIIADVGPMLGANKTELQITQFIVDEINALLASGVMVDPFVTNAAAHLATLNHRIVVLVTKGAS